VKRGGIIAYPNGVEPEPKGIPGVRVSAFDGVSSRENFERLNRLIARGPFGVEVSRAYRLEELPQAHQDVPSHHIGKPVLKLRG
jgi:NADPH:quinone reductase-like Zn-dependent oxidoreductase